MLVLFGIFCAGFTFSIVIIALAKRFAANLRLLDVVSADGLKIHKRATPFVGGFGIALGTAMCLLSTVGWWEAQPWRLLIPVALGLSMHVLGLCDDLFRLSPRLRLGIELLAGAGLAYVFVVHERSEATSNLSALSPAYIIALFLFVTGYATTLVNAINMFDGMDGLAGGVALVSTIGVAVVGASRGIPILTPIAVVLGGTLLGFLFFNSHPASVFMGDNGSYFLGFMLAVLSLCAVLEGTDSMSNWLGAFLLVGLPLVDASQVIVRRLARGVSPFLGDRNHVYDLLHAQGFSFPAVAIICYAIQSLLVGVAVVLLLIRPLG